MTIPHWFLTRYTNHLGAASSNFFLQVPQQRLKQIKSISYIIITYYALAIEACKVAIKLVHHLHHHW